MRNATSFATGAASVTAFALLAAAVLLAGCDIPGLEDAVEEPGTEFRDCPACPAMVTVPAGSYTMGSPAAEAGRHADEAQRRVTIEDPFAVGVYEVTFASGMPAPRPATGDRRELGRRAGVRRVALVKDGRGLPVADRGRMGVRRPRGHNHAVPYGSDHLHRSGQLRRPERSLRLRRHRSIPRPADSGRLVSRNAFGLYDVHGNVAELVADCYDARTADCTRRVVRGGSWGSRPEIVRSAYRSWCAPTLRNLHNGFRVARTLTP